eukprot:CAMPEP_0202692262 /NCGR_PEP_ID=MMETSP1385-20130828/6683_1 /ASSEMBLY_ACC=CAM_ASM_000861 /TAXON_ID=933848 /ORGANISM="Elphidium margaritaceum" /LENGTH=550 /DNA_ID=CAMNT_0049347757 /DNA_START=39 /DNA_END=1691 /DNA_ORIENTATION=+
MDAVLVQKALLQNVSYQQTIQWKIDTLKQQLIENMEKQRMLKSLISKYDLRKLCGFRGARRNDFFDAPFWMFDAKNKSVGTVAPQIHNADVKHYQQKLGRDYRIDHILAHNQYRFTLAEQRTLAKSIANACRQVYMQQIHQSHNHDPQALQRELDKVRRLDADNSVWALKHCRQAEIENSLDWNKIASQQLPSRSAKECRAFWHSHACVTNPGVNRNKTWRAEEKHALMECAERYQGTSWPLIAEQHGYDRTAMQCLSQWITKVKPRAKANQRWSDADDAKLRELVLQHSRNNFLYLAGFFEDKNALQCSSRWLKSTAPYLRSGEWDDTEDMQCVLSHNAYMYDDDDGDDGEDHGDGEAAMNGDAKKPTPTKHGVWSRIARHVTFRNDVKVRERYMNCLHPDVDIESEWTHAEDETLLRLHAQHGDKWSLIARKLNTNRTDCYCRQRFYALAKAAKAKAKAAKRLCGVKRVRNESESDHDNATANKRVKRSVRNTHNSTSTRTLRRSARINRAKQRVSDIPVPAINRIQIYNVAASIPDLVPMGNSKTTQ